MTVTDVLAGRAQRYESCRFDLYDKSGQRLGELMVDGSQPPRISNDVSRALRRQLDSVRVLERPLGDVSSDHVYLGEFDIRSARVIVYWRLQVAAGITEYPQGVFLFADDSLTRVTSGDTSTTALVDQCILLDQSIGRSIGFDQGTSCTYALHVLAELANIPLEVRMIESSAATFGAPVAWPPGRDTWLSVMESISTACGFLPPYFDNGGYLICRTAPNIAATDPDFRYGINTVVIDGTVVESADQLAAPNRYVAVGGNTDAPVVGTYDVPDAAPHSFLNTGVRRTRTEDVQGLGDQTMATIIAYCMYVGDRTQYRWLSFDTPVDPRHDTFDILDFDGDRLLQTAWSMSCEVGSVQQHTCRGTYTT